MNGERTDGDTSKRPSRGILVVVVPALIVASGAIIAAVIGNWPSDDASDPSGAIVAPVDGEVLSGAFTAEGTLSDVPGDHRAWLAVQWGNVMFPKEPEIPAQDRAWVHEFVEAGTAEEQLSLVLLLVDDEGQQSIESWIVSGRREGFVGLPADLQGTSRLDVADEFTGRYSAATLW